MNNETNSKTQRLLVLTPDEEEPSAIHSIEDDRVVWSNFESLYQAIQEIVIPGEDWASTNHPFATEREKQILRELIHFLAAEGLIGDARSQVLLVSARLGFPEYQRYKVYMCQPNRTFQRTTHLAFYHDGAVERPVPAILDKVESIVLTAEGVQANDDLSKELQSTLLNLVSKLKSDDSPRYGREQKVLILSEPGDDDTITLPHRIVNDATSASGRNIGFVQGHRYISKENLMDAPKMTSGL